MLGMGTDGQTDGKTKVQSLQYSDSCFMRPITLYKSSVVVVVVIWLIQPSGTNIDDYDDDRSVIWPPRSTVS